MKNKNRKDEILCALHDASADLSARFGVRRIGLFGSHTRAESTASSDIDLLVDLKPGHKDLFNYLRLKEHLEGLLGGRVDLVMSGALKPILRQGILREVAYV